MMFFKTSSLCKSGDVLLCVSQMARIRTKFPSTHVKRIAVSSMDVLIRASALVAESDGDFNSRSVGGVYGDRMHGDHVGGAIHGSPEIRWVEENVHADGLMWPGSGA